jgi:NitT/TauT family transport system ATP-binding protein
MTGEAQGVATAVEKTRPDGAALTTGKPHIELRDVAVTFGADRIFSDLTLAIAEGEFVCLLGPSGCGKSTMIRIIGGLIDPSQGLVRVAGLPPLAARNALAYVFQSPRLVPWRNARDNVGLAIELRTPSVAKADRHARAEKLLQMVGLARDVDKFPAMLSGGERQRVAIARALAVDPSIILMDEPFSALDPDTRRRMRADLTALWQLTRKTIVFVTHDLDEAVELADRIVVFSAKPTRILDTVAITELRPRTVNASAALRATREHLLQLFQGQSSIRWETDT